MAIQFQDGVTFQGDTVVLTGATIYRHCKFIGCLLVLRPHQLSDGRLFPIEDSRIELCRFHLDFIIRDVPQWNELKDLLPILFPPRLENLHKPCGKDRRKTVTELNNYLR